MTKADKFIEEHTSNQANISIEISNGGKIQSCSIPWLTPDQARRAVEIAKEEIYEWLEEHKDMSNYTWYDEIEHESGITDKCINDLKQAMK